MAWVVEAQSRTAPRGSLFLPLLRAELRQFWWLQPAILGSGLGVWALLAAVTARVSTDGRPEGVIFNYMGSLILSLFPVLLTGPIMAGLGPVNRQLFWFGLPVSRRTVNLLRLLGPAVSCWPALLTWPLIIFLLRGVYGPVSPWVVVNSALAVGLGIILSQRTSLAAFIIFLIMPLQVALVHFIPGGGPLGITWANCISSQWATAALLAAGAGLAVYSLNSHPPRKK